MIVISKFLDKYGKIQTTIILSYICVLASLIISYFAWLLFLEPIYLDEILLIAAICPTIIAPVVIYHYSSLTEEFMSKSEQLSEALKEVRQLTGCRPICTYSRNIDVDGASVIQEEYMKPHPKTGFTRCIYSENFNDIQSKFLN